MARSAILLVAAALGAWGAWIPVKAQVAQLLIQRSWDARVPGQPAARPWPWADTEPVGELSFRGHRWIVLAGATGRTLAFGPGHVDGTARPGHPGRVAIAGHRDTHFRVLASARPGDLIELVDPTGARHRYRVVQTRVVHETEIGLLHGPDGLALITCYPIDAIVPGGPWRYVVRAERERGSVEHDPQEDVGHHVR